MVDVFISYSRTDLAAVTRLAEAVEAAGYDVWWDADLPPHMSYGDVITAKIGAAKAAIVVWSSASVQSEWVRAEADVARNQKKLIQTALDDVMPPLPFNQIQFAEIGDWQGEPDHPGWRKVKVSLAELCGRPEQASAAVAAPRQPRVSPQPAASPTPASKSSRRLLYGALALIGAVVVLGAGIQLGRGTAGPASPAENAAAGGETAALLPPAPTTAAPTTAASSAAVPASEEPDDRIRVIVIMNVSSQTLRELYASPVTSDNWEEDLLGARVLAVGESINADIDNGTDECIYDLKAVMADDRELIQRGVNVCAVGRWTIGDSGDSVS